VSNFDQLVQLVESLGARVGDQAIELGAKVLIQNAQKKE
jgi:hypothetical protein